VCTPCCGDVLLLRDVEDFLHERSIKISRETVRHWSSLFAPMFAAETAPAALSL
jgi:transposase-like protein